MASYETKDRSHQSRPFGRVHHDPSVSDLHRQNTTSVNRLKSKIRDLTRLLGHSEKLPADVRIEKERALVGYRQDLQEIEKVKRRQKMISRYHKVRFFERKKATRHLKRIRKRLSAESLDAAERERLHKESHDAEVDINYTIYFPLTQKYQSLYATTPKEGQGAGEESNDFERPKRECSAKPKLWGFVAKCMEEGTLELLRDGKLSETIVPEKSYLGSEPARQDVSTGKRHFAPGMKSSKAEDVTKTPDDDSDGGFFEE